MNLTKKKIKEIERVDVIIASLKNIGYDTSFLEFAPDEWLNCDKQMFDLAVEVQMAYYNQIKEILNLTK